MSALVAMVTTASPAYAQGASPSTGPSDDRATFTPEKIQSCAQAGFEDEQLYGQKDPATDGFVSVTVERLPDGVLAVSTVEITPEGVTAGAIIDAVIIKASEGSNIYEDPAVLPPVLPPPQNYIGPTIVESGNVADVSHYLVCYHFDPDPVDPPVDPDMSRLLVAKRIVAPDGPTAEPLPTEYTVDVTCTTPDGDTITDTFTFDSGGGIGTTSDGSRLMNDIPVGSVCTTVEQTGTLPDGTVVSYLPNTAPDPGVTIEEGTVTIVRVVNDFTDVEGAAGNLTITKAVDDPSGRVDGMSFTIDAACQGPVVERVVLADGETTEVGPVEADSYCIVREETGDLPDDWEVTYLVDGEEPTATAPGGAPVFPVTANMTVEVTVTNVVPECPDGQVPDPDDITACVPVPTNGLAMTGNVGWATPALGVGLLGGGGLLMLAAKRRRTAH